MRTLTITRQKSFVASLATDLVYIEDPVEAELTINGVPCRKLGKLKSGKTATFEIDHAQRRIFLIVDKLSKECCNASVTVPAGDEPVSYSGKHHFVYGSNPFRFDGVELSEEEKKQQKKNAGKGIWIMVAAIAIGLVVGSFIGKGMAGGDIPAVSAEPKTFAKQDFSITLTEAFTEGSEEGFFACYESRDAVVLVVREERQGLEITLEEYAQLVLENNEMEHLTQYSREDYIWVEYTQDVEGQEFYYLVACYCGEDACWVINFATPAGNDREYKEGFFTWADSVSLESNI